jgi:hypothetical protein
MPSFTVQRSALVALKTDTAASSTENPATAAAELNRLLCMMTEPSAIGFKAADSRS